MNKNYGYTIRARGLHKSKTFRRFELCESAAFGVLIDGAEYTKTEVKMRGGAITLERGQFCFSLRHLAQEFRRKICWVKKLLDYLLEEGSLKIVGRAPSGSRIFQITNYDFYQDPKNYRNPDYYEEDEDVVFYGEDENFAQNDQCTEINTSQTPFKHSSNTFQTEAARCNISKKYEIDEGCERGWEGEKPKNANTSLYYSNTNKKNKTTKAAACAGAREAEAVASPEPDAAAQLFEEDFFESGFEEVEPVAPPEPEPQAPERTEQPKGDWQKASVAGFVSSQSVPARAERPKRAQQTPASPRKVWNGPEDPQLRQVVEVAWPALSPNIAAYNLRDRRWLDQLKAEGLDFEEDILPAIAARVPRVLNPVGCLRYFAGACRDAFAKKQAKSARDSEIDRIFDELFPDDEPQAIAA